MPAKSRWLYYGFARFTRFSMQRHFHALRLAKPGFPDVASDAPLLVYLNHPSWWDPLTGLMLADQGWPHRFHYAPIDAAAIEEYAFFAKLGFFGIDPTQRSGGARFLKIGQALMADPNHALWVTAQGHFADPRQRPLELQAGTAHLLRRLERAIVLPLALEYPFWTEKRPEALACFGDPIHVSEQPRRSVRAWQQQLTTHLEDAMDRLAGLAMRREGDDWQTLLAGHVGTTPIYDGWRALRAKWRGRSFRAAHDEITQHD
jgi:1-acyl-sn-glycerol-3-phosphate acyltransferase